MVWRFTPATIWSHPGNVLDANLVAHRQDFDALFPWRFITFPSTKDPHWTHDYPGRSTVQMYACIDYKDYYALWAGTRWMKRGDGYLARKAAIQQRLLAELFRHVPQADPHIDHVEVSTPLSYEIGVFSSGGGLIQAAVGIGGSTGLLFLNRLGLARNAASRVAQVRRGQAVVVDGLSDGVRVLSSSVRWRAPDSRAPTSRSVCARTCGAACAPPTSRKPCFNRSSSFPLRLRPSRPGDLRWGQSAGASLGRPAEIPP